MTPSIIAFRSNSDVHSVPRSTSGDAFEADFQRLKTRLHRELIDSLDLGRIGQMDEPRLRAHIRHAAEKLLASRREALSSVDQERLVDELLAESFGLGPLEPFMRDPAVTDILVNGPHEVFIERHGRLEETKALFADNAHLLQIIQRVAARVGRRIDELSPMVDARLPDGSRVNAIIPPLALRGPTLSIRRFGAKPLELEDLLRFGSISPDVVDFLRAAITARVNILVSGGTGAGKTTLLNCLSRFVPDGERLVTVEDSAELQLQRRHVVSLETRPASAEGTGEVTPRDLVRNSLRMRPDRIILGEVRGGEALDMLQAMNTGHEGSLTTIHANDTLDALSRLEVMVSMAGFDLPVMVVRRYIASAITLVVHVARLQGGVRRVTRVSEINGVADGEYVMQDLFRFHQQGVDEAGRTRGVFAATGQVPQCVRRFEELGVDFRGDLFVATEVPAATNLAATVRRTTNLGEK